MEVKLRQRPDIHLHLPLFQSKPNFSSHSLFLESWSKSGTVLKKHFRSRVEKWRFHIQEISKGQCSAKHYLVHVVKRGETLTSISKQYGVPMYEIAGANKNLVDFDFVFEGQQLNIPSAAKKFEVVKRSWSADFKLPEKDYGSFNILNGVLDQKNFSMLYSRCTPHARTIGSFLVLVPLMAFCIRCIMGAFQTRVFGELRHQAVNESVVKHHRSKGGRWRSALSDAWEPEKTDAESIPDSTDQSEDLAQVSFEETSHAYRKLEHDYQEFLSQCGMSKWGYWRGGSTR